MSDLTIFNKILLEHLKKAIEDGTVNEGIPRTKVEQKDGKYFAQIEGFAPQSGYTPEDALSALHDYLLNYYNRLQKSAQGKHSREQKIVLESFLSLQCCDCGFSPDTYCYCRGFETS